MKRRSCARQHHTRSTSVFIGLCHRTSIAVHSHLIVSVWTTVSVAKRICCISDSFSLFRTMRLVDNQLDAHFFFMYVYVHFYSVHVSDSYVSIIRRIIVSMRHLAYATPCDDRLVCRSVCSCVPDGYLHRMTHSGVAFIQ